MTDQQLSAELTARRLGRLFDRSTALAVHTAAVVARTQWSEIINQLHFVEACTDDDLCQELATALIALNGMVGRSAALLEDKE